MPISQSSLVGVSGEYYIMYRLLQMGFIAALAPTGVPNSDLIVTDVEGKHVAAIQVKTRTKKGSDGGWAMKEKHQTLSSPNLFYCFVELEDDAMKSPSVFILPSEIVANAISTSHRVWLTTPGKNGRAHKDTNMRRLLPDYSKTLKLNEDLIKIYGPNWLERYREAWHVLNISHT